MRLPLPGQPVRGSRSGAPIMALFDLLGRRWSMGVLWTLAEAGPCSFRDLQARCETISPGVLNTRLKELRLSRLIDHGPDGYVVLPRGLELYRMILPLGSWAKSWARDLVPARAATVRGSSVSKRAGNRGR